MAKNTGHGSRRATITTAKSKDSSSTWSMRSASTGRFAKARNNGGNFDAQKSK